MRGPCARAHHGVRLSGARLAVREDAHVVAVDDRPDDTLNLAKHLLCEGKRTMSVVF